MTKATATQTVEVPAMHTAPAQTSLRSRLRACRSFFLTPGSRPERFAAALDGDGIMVDLESTVAPSDKARAREAALAFFAQPAETRFARLLRINSPRTRCRSCQPG